ncbi:carotenoid biosynthesis protein [[Mycobacterium] zoologicum]|uniref:carotenoid biosynthesis protein n=1 Tax=[Mycobacterium] zoologicum TaxID=2872311 RepID=UPI001CDB233C|nr:carotenoid biosynthesis protein [Mycolicibacter sp. MYC101]MEB3063228.1 carotenoid biosynthesis protein [Mycolicibacter sp. MYC101]
MVVLSGDEVGDSYAATVSTPVSSASPTAPRGAGLVITCWCVLAVWLVATVGNAVSAGSSRAADAEAIWGAALLVFVVLHTFTLYRPAGVIAYFAIAVTVGFGLEACSVATGFPFGFYTHHMAGPRALGIPFPVVAAWVMIAWVAWILARVIVGECRSRRLAVLGTPVVATLIAGGYDLVIDPFGAYVRQVFSYRSPSGVLGVPLSNYVGWLITGWVLFQTFALIERRWRREPTASTRSALLMPAVVWFGLGLQVNLGLLLVDDAATTTIAGRAVALKDVYETCVEMTWFMMGLVVVIAVVRLFSTETPGPDGTQ